MAFNRIFYLVALIVLGFSESVMAQELGRADQALNDTISNFVVGIMTDTGSNFYQFVRSMMMGLAFIGTAWYVIMWALKEYSDGELIMYVLTAILVFTFYFNYNAGVSEFWAWSDSIGLGVQEEAVGTRDPIFVGSQINEAISRFFLSDVSLWDGMGAIFAIIIFKLVSMILSIVVFIISMWSVWGYAFAKITGLVFLPLLFLPITRGFFEKWFHILLGFWFFNMFSKIALSLYHLYFFAIFGAVSDPLEFDPIGDRLALGRIILHFLVGIIFLISVGGLASVMASGFGGITSKASSTTAKLAALATKLITKA